MYYTVDWKARRETGKTKNSQGKKTTQRGKKKRKGKQKRDGGCQPWRRNCPLRQNTWEKKEKWNSAHFSERIDGNHATNKWLWAATLLGVLQIILSQKHTPGHCGANATDGHYWFHAARVCRAKSVQTKEGIQPRTLMILKYNAGTATSVMNVSTFSDYSEEGKTSILGVQSHDSWDTKSEAVFCGRNDKSHGLKRWISVSGHKSVFPLRR